MSGVSSRAGTSRSPSSAAATSPRTCGSRVEMIKADHRQRMYTFLWISLSCHCCNVIPCAEGASWRLSNTIRLYKLFVEQIDACPLIYGRGETGGAPRRSWSCRPLSCRPPPRWRTVGPRPDCPAAPAHTTTNLFRSPNGIVHFLRVLLRGEARTKRLLLTAQAPPLNPP